MRSAQLKHPIRIERNTPTLNAFGEEENVWSIFAQRRASITPLRGREFWTAQELESEVTHRINIRWDEKVGQINTKDRIMDGTRVFDLKAIINPKERNRELEIMAIEKV